MKKIHELKVLNQGEAARRPDASASGGRLPLEDAPVGGAKKQVELSPIHDFARKLHQDGTLENLKQYVRWQAELRQRIARGDTLEEVTSGLAVPDFAPVSINLDITTACNYACDHCVDMDILNQPIKYQHQRLLDSIALMAEKGLRSVIVIGGGEPTVYPKFSETLRFMKDLGLQVSVVSNGSGMKKIEAVADCLDEDDWVRLSLDSASDEVFQAMHKPKQAITLDEICAGVPPIKKKNAAFKIGYSFIITWKGATINDSKIVENLHEIVDGAKRARDWGFDYIAYKPFLTRAEANNAEVVDLKDTNERFEAIVEEISREVDRAAAELETDTFKVYKTTNLKVLQNKSYRDFMHQPRTCHMQFFRQVLSPLGMYNCPVYRNQPHGQVGGNEAYADRESYDATRARTAERIVNFDATHECQEVTCLYNHANWWIEELIADPTKLDGLQLVQGGRPDYFL